MKFARGRKVSAPRIVLNLIYLPSGVRIPRFSQLSKFSSGRSARLTFKRKLPGLPNRTVSDSEFHRFIIELPENAGERCLVVAEADLDSLSSANLMAKNKHSFLMCAKVHNTYLQKVLMLTYTVREEIIGPTKIFCLNHIFLGYSNTRMVHWKNYFCIWDYKIFSTRMILLPLSCFYLCTYIIEKTKRT